MNKDDLSKRKMMEKQFSQFFKMHDYGSVSIWNVPSCYYPTNTVCSYQKLMEKSGNQELFKQISYDVGRLQGLISVKMMSSFFGIKNPKEIIDSLTMQSSFMGFGIMEIIKFDEKTSSFIIANKTTPYAKEYLKLFGKQKGSIDHYFAGLFCGTFSEMMKKELICQETQCIAKGDKVCLFETRPAKENEKKGLFTHEELSKVLELKQLLKK